MKLKEVLKKVEGIQTVESIMDLLGVSRNKAIYYAHRLNKQGYVKTKRLSNNKRVYNISFENKLGGNSYYDIINQYSQIKVAVPVVYRIYGKESSLEEALVYAIKTGNFRTILASLALFKKIDDWPKLYNLAKQNRIERQVGTLYDVARRIMRVRRMTIRFRNNSIPKSNYKFCYIIPGLRSNDFHDIEKVWRVYLPFNKKDLEGYK